MMMSSTQIITLLLALACLQYAQCGTFYVTTELSDQCKYTGYKPSGDVPNIDHIQSKAAKIQESSLQSIVGKFNEGAGITSATLGVMNSAGKLLNSAPHVAAALGALSVAMGLVVGSVGPQDILDKANEAVAALTADVNDRMDKMKDYVDVRVIQLEKGLISSKYKVFFYYWIHCAEERSTEKALNCQQDVERNLKSARFEFEILHEKQESMDPNGPSRFRYTHQFLKEYASKYKSPSHYDVKRLEANLIPFRNFASLHLMVLQTLAAIFKNHADDLQCREYKHYLEDIAERAEEYIKYAKWAKEWIYIRNYEENLWNTIPGRSRLAAPYFQQSGGFIPTMKCARKSGSKAKGRITSQCTVECFQMKDDNTCTYTDTIYKRLQPGAIRRNYSKLTNDIDVANIYNRRNHRNEICVGFLSSLAHDLNSYWNSEVLELTKVWQNYSDSAKAALEKVTDC